MSGGHENEDGPQPNGEGGAGGPENREGAARAWWRVLVEAATVIAVPSALLYVLGVLAFWFRIASEYDGISLGTTWYAASLVPRNTAAASGMEAVARGIAYGALAIALLLFVAYAVLYARSRRGGGRERVKLLSVPLFVPFYPLSAALTYLLLDRYLSEVGGYGLLAALRVLAFMALLLSLSVIPLALGTESERNVLRSALRFYPKPVYWLGAAFLVLGLTASVLTPRQTSLSCLWKEDPEGEVFEANVADTQSEVEPLQWTLQGGFLSKGDGTWYVLTEANRLQAIPNDDSTRVVGGDFSVRYLEVGQDGAPTGEPVPEDDMEPLRPYVAVKHCSGFPSQPTIISFEGATVPESGT